MKTKAQRQSEIRRIIAKGNVSSQEELLTALKKRGFELTQATLSRDLKFLQVAKVSHPVYGYVYVISSEKREQAGSFRSSEYILEDGFKGLEFSGNLAVIKTLPGYASTIAAIIDSAHKWEILGTVAGDDTVLVIRREGITNNDLIKVLGAIIPKLKSKF